MSAVMDGTGTFPHQILGVLSKGHIIAGPGFNRWLVPPGGLATMGFGCGLLRVHDGQCICVPHRADCGQVLLTNKTPC